MTSYLRSRSILPMSNRKRVLIVEDHEATRQGLRALLTNAGYEVEAAGDFSQARRALSEHAPDLLITDLRLGEYNGLQLVAAVPLGIPSIVVPGFPDAVLGADALKLGAHYITKPVDAQALMNLMDEALVSAAERHSQASTRRWDRKPVGGKVSALV